MNNRVIIILFILFMLIVAYSSLQKTAPQQSISPTPTIILQQVTPAPTAIPTIATPTSTLNAHPGFRVNGGGEAGDN